MKPHKHCELIKAWADGAEIQRRKYASNEWVDTDPDWRVGTEYRIKPRTVKREGWINLYRFERGSVHADATVYKKFEAAILHLSLSHKNDIGHIATVKVEWEEVE